MVETILVCGYIHGTLETTGIKDRHFLKVVSIFSIGETSAQYPTEGTKVFFYPQIGNGRHKTKDDYKNSLVAVSLEEALKLIRKAYRSQKYNRRLLPAIDMLEGLINFPDDEIICVFYHH